MSIELKLMMVPVVFILLRMWSLILTIIVVEAQYNLSPNAISFFLHISVSQCKRVYIYSEHVFMEVVQNTAATLSKLTIRNTSVRLMTYLLLHMLSNNGKQIIFKMQCSVSINQCVARFSCVKNFSTPVP